MKIVHITITLHTGGAERMLSRVVENLDSTRFTPTVVTLMDGGPVAAHLRERGVPVHELGMRSLWHLPLVLWRLWRLSRRLAPDAVQGWMYHGNLAAALMVRWAQGAPALYWNIRHSLPDMGHEKRLTRLLIRGGSRWSSRAAKVVYNARVSVGQHVTQGYDQANALVIPNGFDLQVWRADVSARQALRTSLGLAPDTVLVGYVGRDHPLKGLDVLVAAAGRVGADWPGVHFVCAGRGVDDGNQSLAKQIAAAGCAERFHLLGERSDVPGVLAGLDVFCLPSRSEGFPNALGEAMACEVACVATAVGEVPVMLEGITEPVVPGDPDALAAGLGDLLGQSAAERQALGARCRARIVARYALPEVIARYETLYLEAGTLAN